MITTPIAQKWPGVRPFEISCQTSSIVKRMCCCKYSETVASESLNAKWLAGWDVMCLIDRNNQWLGLLFLSFLSIHNTWFICWDVFSRRAGPAMRSQRSQGTQLLFPRWQVPMGCWPPWWPGLQAKPTGNPKQTKEASVKHKRFT